MKAELNGAVVLSLTMEEARLLRQAISSQALNPRPGYLLYDQPVVELWRALTELFEGKRDWSAK